MKYVVYVLLAIITIATGYQWSVVSDMPDKYVRKDTYQYNQQHIDRSLDSIQQKLDGIKDQIMRFHTTNP